MKKVLLVVSLISVLLLAGCNKNEVNNDVNNVPETVTDNHQEENENIIEQVLKFPNIELVPIDKSIFDGVPLLPVSIQGTICIYPTELYEGFFVAKIKKK